MTDDLITWLRAQLDEDERAARFVAERNVENLIPAAVIDKTGATVFFTDEAYGLVRRVLDPARVLAEVDAKREIIAKYEGACRAVDREPDNRDQQVFAMALSHAVAALTGPYADRPGYREEWRP